MKSRQSREQALLAEVEELDLQIMRASVLAASVQCEDARIQRLILCVLESKDGSENPMLERMRQQLNQLTAHTIMTGQQIVSDCLAGPDDPRGRTVAG
jgi:hypothetical protein